MKDWFPEALIYQINPRSLAAREPRNAFEALLEAREGGIHEPPLAYIARHLHLLKDLGVTVIQMLPPFEIGQACRKGIGSFYAARDYHKIDAEHGSVADLAAVVTESHRLGLRIIVDMVPNHTARDHTWITAHPDYYVQAPDGSPAYDWDWSDTAKLDYRNPALRDAMREVYAHWLSFAGGDGFDGFRIDMAHFINDRSFWDEAIPRLRALHPHKDLLFLAECYGIDNNLDLFRRGFNGAYDDELYKCCEFLYARDAAGGSHLSLSHDALRHDGFAPVLASFRSGGIAGAVRHCVESYLNAAPTLPHPVHLARYIDNHDEGRGLHRFGEGAARAFSTLIHLLPGTIPFLLTGQEFGAVNRPSIHERFGLCDKGYRLVTESGERKVEGIEFEGNLFARGSAARKHWLKHYHRLAGLRLSHPELTRGTWEWFDCGEAAAAPNRQVVSFLRRHAGSTLLCAVNLGPESRELAHPAFERSKNLFGHDSVGLLPGFEVTVRRLDPT